MSNLRTLCRPQTVFSFISFQHQFRSRVSFRNPNCKPRLPSPFLYSTIASRGSNPWFRVNQRRTVAKATNWAEQKSPYETLELEGDADDEQIKNAYRRLAKFYHPDGSAGTWEMFCFSLQECSYEAVMASECFFNCVPYNLVVIQLSCGGIVY
ncbi:hypothetical protein GmHk_06G015659 [Glycine max]|nr:hypothetical protein GmHk_06G015659 [Glycine max]KAH1245294.1 hypothetical protein GmHk_06G015659 [Glycine max]